MQDTSPNAPATGIRLEPSRQQFRRLLAANPNYFGTFPAIGLEPVEPKSVDTAYEELTCVAYTPKQDRIEATVLVKRSSGYSGDLCSTGSFEYVRFYIDYGSGWEDAGLAAVNVHDVPVGEDCREDATHPLSYVCSVGHTPRRDWCGRPVLPRIRAILSWNLEPPAGEPDWEPPWGNVHDCRAQIAPRSFVIADIAAKLSTELVAFIPEKVLEEPPHPEPDPGPLQALSLEALATAYRRLDVPAHRFAFSALAKAELEPVASPATIAGAALSAKAAGIELSEVLKALEDTSGNTTYEELECLGLDEGARSLVASFRVKLSSGYSGPPCRAGSTEYVAFWADWDDDCGFEYLGTVPTTAHDYEDLEDDLCYAAVLPVDLDAHRRDCKEPVLRRVRAVLSWETPPSTTDPDAVPYWGNRIDSHVQLAPGRPYDGTARFTIVGGVASQDVDLTSGLTAPGAVLGPSTTPLPPSCPFAGWVVLHGPLDPALAGHQYRIRATNVDGSGSMALTVPFTRVDSDGFAHTVTPDPTDGWVSWPTWQQNTTGILGRSAPGGDDRWDFTLELDVAGNVVDTARVRMDNTVRTVAELSDTVNAGALSLQLGGACKVPQGLVNGSFVARDLHFRQWTITVLGGSGGPLPAPLGATTQTPFGGSPFTLDFSAPVEPCGYVVRLTIYDRAIVNSVGTSHYATIDRGLCLE